MAYFHLNRAVCGGYLDSPAVDFNTKNGRRACWFSVRVQKADNIFGYVNVMCYSERLIQLADEYMIPENVGKRLAVSGEILFPSDASKAVMLGLSDVTFADGFTGREEARRIRDNRPDFSDGI